MKVDKIERCICSDGLKDDGSITFGMPILTVSQGQEYYAECPRCGRGGFPYYKSPYLALKEWNRYQNESRAIERGEFPV